MEYYMQAIGDNAAVSPFRVHGSRDCYVQPRLVAPNITQRDTPCYTFQPSKAMVAIVPSVSSPARLSSNDVFDENPSARQWYDLIRTI